MNEPIILKTNETPSYFNKEIVLGALLGSSTENPSLIVLGTVIGAFIGENRMAREKEYGKIVDLKTSVSKDALLGAIVGGQMGAGIAALALRASGMANLSLRKKAIITATGLAGMVVGTYTGSKYGKKAYDKEYATAMLQQQQRQVSRCKSVNDGQMQGTSTINNYSAAILAERENSSKINSM